MGIHPTRSVYENWFDRKKLDAFAKTPGVIAIGECGLDYHFGKESYYSFPKTERIHEAALGENEDTGNQRRRNFLHCPRNLVRHCTAKPKSECRLSLHINTKHLSQPCQERVRVLTPHCCRHTYVSKMQMLGVDLATIQSIDGHADVGVTKHYLHVQDPMRQAAIEKFSNAFSENPKASHLNILVFLESS